GGRKGRGAEGGGERGRALKADPRGNGGKSALASARGGCRSSRLWLLNSFLELPPRPAPVSPLGGERRGGDDNERSDRPWLFPVDIYAEHSEHCETAEH